MSTAAQPGRTAAVLQLDDVAAEFGGREVVRGVSLQVGAGEMLALVGPSGAGKSTLARVAVGMLRPARGSVWVEGRELGRLRPEEMRRQRSRMQMIYQDPQRSLDPCMTVAAIVTEGLEAHAAPGELPGPGWSRRRRAWRRRQAEPWLVRVGLEPGVGDRLPGSLSGGQRQRVAIARAVAPGPALLVADEPVAALDAPVALQILELLAGLQRELGLACLLVSHNLDQAAGYASRLAVMGEGQIVETGATRQMLAQPRHALTRELLAARLAWPWAPGAVSSE